jgi:hypothetical protein
MYPDPDSDPDSAIFIIDLQDDNETLIFLNKFFCILLFEGTFTSFFKDKKPKRSHETEEISYYFLLFLLNGRRSGSRRL